MVHKHFEIGSRKDYYIPEIDFWNIAKGILKEREHSEFDRALRTVGESLEMVKADQANPEDAELSEFYQQRMQAMQSFFETLDSLVNTLLAIDNLVSLSTLQNFLKKQS